MVLPPVKINLTDNLEKDLTVPPRRASVGLMPWNRAKALEKLSGVS